METQPFFAQSAAPTNSLLRDALGSTFVFHEELSHVTDGFGREWKYYNKGGWVQKVFDKKKALLYFIPGEDGFDVSLTLRATEREGFLQDHCFPQLQDQLEKAKKFPEGFFLQFSIQDKKSFNTCKPLIAKLVEIRNPI